MFRAFLVIVTLILCFACGQPKGAGRYISENDTAFSKDIRDISARINKDPNNAALYYNRGNAFYYQDKFKDAAIDLETAVLLDSNNAVYHHLLGETILELDSADSRKARQHLEKAVALKPDFHDAALTLAKFYLARQEYEKAEKLLKGMTGVPEFAARSFVYLGISKKEQKDTVQAMTYFDKASQLDPQNYDAAMQIALIKSAQNDPLAEKYFDKVIALNEFSDEAFYGKGLLLQRQGKYKDALANYEKVRTLNPGHILCLYNSAVIYNLFEDYTRAAEMCNRALDLDAKNANALALRGYTYEKRGNKTAAEADYRSALEIDPQNAPALAGLKALGR